MQFLRAVRTLRAGLGSFGTRIWQSVIGAGQGLAEALGFGREAGVEAEPVPTWHEGYQVAVAIGRETDFAAIEPTAYVPVDWYAFSEVPWDKPISYRFKVYGRDLATGQFVHQTRDLTLSRPVTVGEAENIMMGHLDTTGASPMYEIFDLTLVGASRRAGEEWRW